VWTRVLVYAPAWLKSGLPLSEDLPLVDKEFFPVENGSSPIRGDGRALRAQ
jgi:hypothetical protein